MLITIKDFCTRYATSHSTAYREIEAGRLAIRKIGRATRIAVVDAEKWAAALPVKGGEMADG